MADELYMSINEPWDYEDDMSNFSGTGWSIASGGAVTQQSGYVRIDQSAGTDAIYYPAPNKTLPYTIECRVKSGGTQNAFRTGNGTTHVYVYFPDTGGVPRNYRIVIRNYTASKGDVLLFEDGKLLKDKADTTESGTFTALYYYVTSTAATGDYLEVHHHRHLSGCDPGPPVSNQLLTTHFLDGRAGYELLFERSGGWMPPRSFIEDNIPFEPGSIYRQTLVDSRDISLGISITGTSKSDLNAKLRALLKTIREPCKLFVKMSDGYRYLSPCRYIRGMEGEEKADVTGQKWQKAVITFRAFDPYWIWAASGYGISPDITSFFFTTGPIQQLAVQVDGDVETWPEFYIAGPGNNPTVTNLTTGKSFTINTSLATNSDYVYINTKPGQRTIKDKNGNIIWSSLSTTSNTFFSLIPGENSIKVQYASGTDTTTTVRMFHSERFLGV